MIDAEEIIPGKSIGRFCVGTNYEQLLLLISHNCKIVSDNEYSFVISFQCYKFYIRKDDNLINQILVGPGFKGKFKGSIGIGSTLEAVKKIAGDYYQDLNVYLLHEYPGICFELDDASNWNSEEDKIDPNFDYDGDEHLEWVYFESQIPIRYISVFSS